MRWLLVQPGPDFSVADVFNGWADALRSLGEQVAVYNTSDRLTFFGSALVETGTVDETGHPEIRKMVDNEEAIRLAMSGIWEPLYKGWPDVVLCVSAFFTPPAMLDLMRARGHKVVFVATEAPYQDQEQITRAEHADITLLNDPVNIDSYRAVCPIVEYVPHAYRPTVHCPGPASPRPRSDLAFVGTGYESRIQFFEAMDLTGLDVLLAGNWQPLLADEHKDSPLRRHLANEPDECVDNSMAVQAYRSARAGINFYRREAEDESQSHGWAMGPREVEMAATGLWFLRDKRGEGDAVLPMLPTFDGPGDAGEILRWYLAHDKDRAAAALAARAAIAGRTFEANARMLLQLLERQPATI